jgi:hypothetical protein
LYLDLLLSAAAAAAVAVFAGHVPAAEETLARAIQIERGVAAGGGLVSVGAPHGCGVEKRRQAGHCVVSLGTGLFLFVLRCGSPFRRRNRGIASHRIGFAWWGLRCPNDGCGSYTRIDPRKWVVFAYEIPPPMID